tara:strand:+ start:12297 stop:12458 length:162 start_codon:yes stop_codon:yes gene_type:complete
MTNPLDPNPGFPSCLLGACITFGVGGATLYLSIYNPEPLLHEDEDIAYGKMRV